LKITLLGGAGVRVPLVVTGLLRAYRDLRVDELALWDVNPQRQRVIARLCETMVERAGVPLRIRPAPSADAAIADADFIIASIRVGGAAARIADERIALAHGVLGQETVGAGGWAMALRSIPATLEFVRLQERLAPRSWLLNFTNPVGIVLQALVAAGARRVIGICDTPRELFENAAAQLGIDFNAAFFDYFGLNHLGWVRQILLNNEDHLPRLLAQPEKVAHLYHVPLFDPQELAELRLLPTEYVYFYLHPEAALARLRQAGTTRGESVAAQEQELMSTLAASDADAAAMLRLYEDYLARRNATYFRLETGSAPSAQELEQARRDLYSKAAGYDRIAVDVMRAIRGNTAATFPLDVMNNGALSDLDAADAVELPCVVDAAGARPLPAGAVPESVRPLLLQVKEYERLTAQAALSGSLTQAIEGLARNPLVSNRATAEALAREYQAAHRPWLDYLH
jgi:6-phospho-beta-glucosidase